MHSTFTLSALITALSVAGGAHAWAKTSDGRWVANNVVYHMGAGRYLHEACMGQNDGKPTGQSNGEGTDCTFWTSGVGDMKDGKCGYIQIDSLTCGGEDFNWETTVQWCEIPGHEGDCDFSKREVKWNA